MKIGIAALLVGSFLVVPTLARSEGGLEMGALGGAVAGSLMGPGSDRVEHAVIGAVVGALLGTAIDAEEQSRHGTHTARSATWSEPDYVVTYPTTRYVIAEPIHDRDEHRWDRHKRHRRHHFRHGHRHHHHGHNHWRDGY